MIAKANIIVKVELATSVGNFTLARLDDKSQTFSRGLFPRDTVWSWPIVLLLRSPGQFLRRRLFGHLCRVFESWKTWGGILEFWLECSSQHISMFLTPVFRLALIFYSKLQGSPGNLVSNKLLYSITVAPVQVVTHNQVLLAWPVYNYQSGKKMNKCSIPQCTRTSGNARVSNDWIVYTASSRKSRKMWKLKVRSTVVQ